MTTRAAQIRQELADLIIAGELPPGSALEEKPLAARFGVSRTPVRDALRELAGTGLVSIHAGRGAFVAKVDPRLLQELFEAQAEVEALCARFAAARMRATDRHELELLQVDAEESMRSGDDSAFSEYNDRLHDLTYTGSNNAVMIEMARNLRQRAAPFRVRQFYLEHDRMKSSVVEHAAITAAIVAGDGEEAARSMRAHIASTSLHVIRYFQNNPGADDA